MAALVLPVLDALTGMMLWPACLQLGQRSSRGEPGACCQVEESNNYMKAHLQLAALEGEGMVGEILHGPFFVAHHEAHALTHMHTIPNRHRPRRLVKAYKASYQEVLRAMVVNMFVPRSK